MKKQFSIPSLALLAVMLGAGSLALFNSVEKVAQIDQLDPRTLTAAVTGSGSGLIGWYTFDDGAATDSSGSGNTGTVTGASLTTGNVGGALQFDGADDTVSIGKTLFTSYPQSACAWIKPQLKANVQSQYIVYQAPFQFGLFEVDGKLSLSFYNNSNSIYTSPGAIIPDTWQHVCVTVTGNRDAKLYINAAQVAAGVLNDMVFNGTTYIGSNNGAGTTKGLIDDVYIYNRALSANEVGELYSMAGTGDTTREYTLVITNSGSGSVSSSPSGISCGTTCSTKFKVGTVVVLTASPVAGQIPIWTGCNSVTNTGATCTQSMYGDASMSLSYMPTPPAPVISSVNVASVSASRATINWTTDQQADTQIEYGTTVAYEKSTDLKSTLTTSHTQTITGLLSNTTYNYRVKSKNEYAVAGEKIGTFTTSQGGVSAPSYFSALGVASDQINLIWLRSLVEDGTVVSYTVYRNGTAIATIPHIPYQEPYHDTEQQLYQDMGLSPNTTYSYYVTARDSTGNNSAPSVTLSATTKSGSPSLIPSDRLANWIPGVTVGVLGGIPTNRTNLIDVTQAPYGADKTGATDASAVINKAISDAKTNDVVYLPTGTYLLSNPLYVSFKSDVTLRGAGMDATILDCRTGCINVRGAEFYNVTQLDKILSGMYKGSTQITLADASSYAPGEYIKISTENDINKPVISPAGNGTMLRSQNALVTARSGNTLTINPPIIGGFDPSGSYATPSNYNVAKYIGIEDLTADGTKGSVQVGIGMGGTYGSWIKNVKIRGVKNYTVSVSDSAQCEIRRSYLDELSKAGGSNGAGLLMGGVTGCLVEDNIVLKSFPIIEINFSSIGNVFAYNYFADQSTNTNHGAHNSFNLYEGNILKDSEFKSDGYYGSESEATYFRNRIDGYIASKRFSRNFTAIGNIVRGYSLGQPNIGNGSSEGFALQSQGVYWKDWNPTSGPLIRGVLTRTSASSGSIKITDSENLNRLFGYMTNNCNGYNPTSDPQGTSCAHPLGIDWGNGKDRTKIRSFMAHQSTDIANGIVTVSGGYPNDLPPTGTVVGIWPRSEGFQELDMDVALTFVRKQNRVGSSIPSNERLSSGQTLPDSLFRSSKPAFFGDLAWPPIDSSNPSSDIAIIPAGYRYKNSSSPSGVSEPIPETPTTDIIPPTITSIVTSAATTATITITTNEATRIQVQYGPSTVYGSITASTTYGNSHSVTLSSFSSNATYHYRVIAADTAGNTTVSSDETFTTLTPPAPVISVAASSVTVPTGTRSTSLIVSTDVSATCKWGTASATYAQLPFSFTASNNGRTHAATITNLIDGANSIYVRCSDTAGIVNTTDTIVTITVSVPNPNDTDLDGVLNSVDSCPATPEDLFSKVNTLGCPLPISSKFTLSNLNATNLKAVTSFSISNASGTIAYESTATPYTLVRTVDDVEEQLDIDAHVSINKNSVFVNSSLIPELNRPATITFNNIYLKNTDNAIFKDGALCSQCMVVSYENRVLVFKVPGFSLIEVMEDEEEETLLHTLSVILQGTGGGTVTGTDISCGTDCAEETLNSTLTAQPNSDSTFTGWSGGVCSGTGTCAITLAADTSVVATFTKKTSSRGGGGRNSGGSRTMISIAPITPQIPGCPANTVCTPASSSNGISFLRYLTTGSTGTDVKALQQALNSLGYTVSLTGAGSRGNETTYFGPATTRAIQKFQCAVIKVCAGSLGYGNFGPLTRVALNARGGTIQTTTIPTTTLPSTYTRNLTLGSTGLDVKALQVFLNTKGFTVSTTGGGSPGNETLYFGPATRAALARFQAANNITPAVGYFGPTTRAKVSGI